MGQLKNKYIRTSAITVDKLADNAVEAIKIKDLNVTGPKLADSAKQAVLESKLIARRTGVLNKMSGTGSDVAVSTEVLAAATTDLAIEALDARGFYVGAVSSIADPKHVELRQHGTNDGIDEGDGHDVYGKLVGGTAHDRVTCESDTGGAIGGKYFDISSATRNFRVWFNTGSSTAPDLVGKVSVEVAVTANDTETSIATKTVNRFTALAISDFSLTRIAGALYFENATKGPSLSALSAGTTGWADVTETSPGYINLEFYKSSDNTAYTFSGSVALDFFFVEVFDLFTEPAEKGLLAIGGVVDSSSANALNNHINNATGAHAASAISADNTDHENATGTDVQSQLDELDGAIGALAATPTNYTPADASVAGHLAGIDEALEGLSAPLTDFADNVLTVHAAGDPTAKLRFNCANIGTGTTKQITMPNRDIDLANLTIQVPEAITITNSMLTNGYVDLAYTPANTPIVLPVGGTPQIWGTDYSIINDGSDVPKRLNWDGLGLEPLLEEGDEIIVLYSIYA